MHSLEVESELGPVGRRVGFRKSGGEIEIYASEAPDILDGARRAVDAPFGGVELQRRGVG